MTPLVAIFSGCSGAFDFIFLKVLHFIMNLSLTIALYDSVSF